MQLISLIVMAIFLLTLAAVSGLGVMQTMRFRYLTSACHSITWVYIGISLVIASLAIVNYASIEW